MAKPKCCISDCQVNSNPKLTHVAFYKLKPKYENSIIRNYVPQNSNKNKFKLVSNMICARHFHLCRLHDHSVSVFFPHLKISVSSQYSNSSETDLNFGKLRNEMTYKSKTKHNDHNYALPFTEGSCVKKQRCEMANKINEASRRTQKLVTSFQTELKQIEESPTTVSISPRIESPFHTIVFSEKMLTFYTGFLSRRSFLEFVELIAPKYQKALFKGHPEGSSPLKLVSRLGIEKELILVLCRLRLGLSGQQDVAERFNISTLMLVPMWTFWMKLLSTSLVELSRKPFEIPRSANNKIIVNCNEIHFQLPEPIGRKLYGLARALIEITSNGYVYDVSDLYPLSVTDEEILERGFPDEYGENEDKSQFNPQSSHILRISKCINNFKILTQTFPTATLQPVLAEFNSFFKICCFLINFIDKPIIKTREDSKKKKPNSQRKFGK